MKVPKKQPQEVFLKKADLSQNSQENTCVGGCFLIKLEALKLQASGFLQNPSGRLLLFLIKSKFI